MYKNKSVFKTVPPELQNTFFVRYSEQDTGGAFHCAHCPPVPCVGEEAPLPGGRFWAKGGRWHRVLKHVPKTGLTEATIHTGPALLFALYSTQTELSSSLKA